MLIFNPDGLILYFRTIVVCLKQTYCTSGISPRLYWWGFPPIGDGVVADGRPGAESECFGIGGSAPCRRTKEAVQT